MLNILVSASNNIIMLVVLGVMFILMMVLSIVPQKKRQKEAQKMMDSLKAGTVIKTIGGFIGKITKIDAQANIITVDISAKLDGSMITCLDRSAVYAVMQPAEDGNMEEVKQEPELAKDDIVDEKVEENKEI